MVVGLTVFWIWMLVDCAKRISVGDTRQVGWLIAICLAQVVGAIVYFVYGRGMRGSVVVT